MTQEKIKNKDNFSNGDDCPKRLVLHNDNDNIYDFVVESLKEVLDYTDEQAEQCTFIAHFRGYCEIKTGKPKNLSLLKKKFERRKINVTIE